jgi:hypothetical protein|tara:strand:- start:2325 stop:2528 length:204 start_codon:yes stop_codon:yes gene_type:complete
MAKKDWIKGAIKKPGAFTAQRDRYNRAHKGKNLTTNQFASLVLKPKSKFSATTKRRANLAKTLRRMK